MRIAAHLILGVVVMPVLLVAVTLIVFSLIYSPAYVVRVITFGVASVDDYQKFPERLLGASRNPFQLSTDLDETHVRSLFQPIFHTDDLDAFLGQKHTQAFIVIQDDTVLYEHYFNGARRDSIVTSFSMAKSFDSALIGSAIADGAIHGVDDPITRYLPELAARDRRFSQVTIRNLLMMSSGIKYVEAFGFWGDDARTYYDPDLRQLALHETQIVDPPGRSFLYNNYHPLLLGMILERTTGMTVTRYLQAKIWGRIGTEYGGSWSTDRAGGLEKLESGINARAIDFAKFGRLYLQRGTWDGAQVVPSSWIDESTQEAASVGASYYPHDGFIPIPGNGYYGYLWWGMRRENGMNDFYARGQYGQFIYISPQTNLIIVRNGRDWGIDGDAWVKAFYAFASALEAKR